MHTFITKKEVVLSARHVPTGRTVHTVDGESIVTPSTLRIASYAGDSGYYLLYFDEQGNELTDTFHDTVEGAMSQAEWEFGVMPEEWLDVRKP